MTRKITGAALAAITAAALAACGSSSAGAQGNQPASSSGSGSSSSSSGGYGYGAGSSSASTSTGAAASAARGATVHIAHTGAGSLLVASNGFTLYLFTADHRNSDHCMKVSGCTGVWPPLTVKGKPTAGSGARASLLGTISIGHGRRQVTYAGHPLYRYTGDGGPGATGYLGFTSFGGTWDGVSASGHAVK